MSRPSHAWSTTTHEAFVDAPVSVDVGDPGFPARDWRGVRLYKSTRSFFTLQVRGPRMRADGTSAKAFCIAGAQMSLAKLKELRDACDAAIRSMEHPSSDSLLPLLRIGEAKVVVEHAAAEADMIFSRGTSQWSASFGALLEMHRMMTIGRSYLGGRPGERSDIAKAIGEAAGAIPQTVCSGGDDAQR